MLKTRVSNSNKSKQTDVAVLQLVVKLPRSLSGFEYRTKINRLRAQLEGYSLLVFFFLYLKLSYHED
jgi:hypothetical protein